METPDKPRGFTHTPDDRLLRRLTRAINVIESWNLPPHPAADWEDFDFENIPTIYRQLLRQISSLKKISPHDLDSELLDTYMDLSNGQKTHIYTKEVDRLIGRINNIYRALKNFRPAVWEIYDDIGRGAAMLKFVVQQPVTGPVINWNKQQSIATEKEPIPASIILSHYDIPTHIEQHLDRIRTLTRLLDELTRPLTNFIGKINQTENNSIPNKALEHPDNETTDKPLIGAQANAGNVTQAQLALFYYYGQEAKCLPNFRNMEQSYKEATAPYGLSWKPFQQWYNKFKSRGVRLADSNRKALVAAIKMLTQYPDALQLAKDELKTANSRNPLT